MRRAELVEFLLERKALQHLTDWEGKDACDYAKENGLALVVKRFQDCSIRKKKADNQELAKMQKDRNMAGNSSFKKSTRSGSIYQKRDNALKNM